MAALRSGKALFIEKSKDETPSSPIPPAVITLLVIGFLVAWERPVQAQTDLPASLPQLGFDIGNIGSCQPAVAVSAFQVNLKTKDVKRVALMGGFGCLFHNWVVPYGAALYIGSGISEAEGASPQANLLIHVSNWIAFGPGVQAIKLPSGDRVFQGLLSFVGSLSFGGTTTYVKEQAVQAAVRTERIMRAAPNSGHIPGN
jgi:hypothetical protein